MSRPLLAVDALAARYGLLHAVRGVSLSLAEDDKLAVVGAHPVSVGAAGGGTE